MTEYIENWDGDMNMNLIAPTVYQYWQLMFFKTLFRQYEDNVMTIYAITDNYPFVDFYQRLIFKIQEDPKNERYNRLCKGFYEDYEGDEHCAYNMARSFAETRDYLKKNISPNEYDWAFRNVHTNVYPALPWSMTPLKFLF